MNKCQTEPVNVAKFWDDLLLGVKGLSSLVIAGSPRNLFKQKNFLFKNRQLDNFNSPEEKIINKLF